MANVLARLSYVNVHRVERASLSIINCTVLSLYLCLCEVYFWLQPVRSIIPKLPSLSVGAAVVGAAP